LHYVDGQNGIKDFDVWSFFSVHPAHLLYAKRHAVKDFGSPKFGVTPDHPNYLGRRVDLFMRSIPPSPDGPAAALRNYLEKGRTKSARLLALKAAVGLEPDSMLGMIIWAPANSAA
jgi:hypothetical protein